jgi:coenzyme F420-reducing hydrogenase alpha subunit
LTKITIALANENLELMEKALEEVLEKEIQDDIETIMYEVEKVVRGYEVWYHWHEKASEIVWGRMKVVIKEICDPKKMIYIYNVDS